MESGLIRDKIHKFSRNKLTLSSFSAGDAFCSKDLPLNSYAQKVVIYFQISGTDFEGHKVGIYKR